MRSKNSIFAIALAALVFSAGPVFAQDDDRMLLEVDEATQALLFADMRGLVKSLDKLMMALSKGDFEKVAWIGEIDLGFGHAKLQAMVEAGATNEQIQLMRERMAANREARAAAGDTGAGQGMAAMFGIPVGVGQSMTDEFRMMGQVLHESAAEMAVTARSVGEMPVAKDYEAVLEKVQLVTSACVSCHDAFRVR